MPSTRSSAATKCISEVPGLVKQTFTSPATNVRTRLSAPFIISLPFALRDFVVCQINHSYDRSSKDARSDSSKMACIFVRDGVFPQRRFWKACHHAPVACEMAQFVACLTYSRQSSHADATILLLTFRHCRAAFL